MKALLLFLMAIVLVAGSHSALAGIKSIFSQTTVSLRGISNISCRTNCLDAMRGSGALSCEIDVRKSAKGDVLLNTNGAFFIRPYNGNGLIEVKN